MFKMFGFGGAKCPRCGHKNGGANGYCAGCGLTPGAPRNEPVLRENRWIPAPDELAVFFGVRELSGMFVKTLRVPATTRAYILQGDKATEVPQGEYEIEGFFSRLNNLLRDQHAEILITRTAAMPVEFTFDDLRTAEHLAVSATFRVSLKIDQVPAFAQHFMTMPGTVTASHLRELLGPSVRQLAAEFVGAQSLRDMSANRDLRLQLDERLQSALKMRLAQFGLAAVQVDTLALRHDKFDANRERVGTLWMVADEQHVQLEHDKALDDLYDAAEWQRIRREEQGARQRFRRTEMQEDANVDRAELSVRGAERLLAVRAREIELYGRIAEAKNRRQAIERGAGDVLAELEHEMRKKAAARADEAGDWEHLRQLARIRMHTELEAAQHDARNARALAQQRFSHQLVLQQIRNKVEQAQSIDDEAHKRNELALLHRAQLAAQSRSHELEAEQHRASVQSLALANAAHKREAERVQEWEDQLALDRRRELLRKGEQADALAQHEKLLRTIEADSIHMRQEHELQLEAEERRHALAAQENEARWQHELRRLDRIGGLSDTAKVALVPGENATVLADYMKTQVHASMDAGQLSALAGVVKPASVRTCPNGHAAASGHFCAQCGAALAA